MKALIGLVLSAIIAGVCGWPTWLLLFARHMLHPVGFWENLVTIGLGFYLLIGVQILFFFLMIFALVALWTALANA